MARFLFGTLPATGHFNPALPLVKRLVERGHEVRWYTAARFRAKVEATGATYLPMKSALDFDADDPDTFPERKDLGAIRQINFDMKRIVLDSGKGQLADFEAICREFPPDVIVSEFMFMGSYLMRELHGILRALLGVFPLILDNRDSPPPPLGLKPWPTPMGRARNRFLNWITPTFIMREAQLYANSIWAETGLPPLKRAFLLELASTADAILQATVPSFEYPLESMPEFVHFIGPLLPPATAKFEPPEWWDELKGDRPVVLVSQGTVAMDHSKLLVPTIRAMAGENVLVVATTSSVPRSELPLDRVPANARIELFIPFGEILPHVDVMVTNGGYGGVQLALAHGVPLVVGGATEDKAEVGARVEWSNAGINLRKDRPGEEQIREAVLEVIENPSFRRKAQSIQAEMKQYDGPGRGCEVLETLAERGKAGAID